MVTGGAGFIGAHVTRDLLNLGWDVTVLDNLTTGSKDNLSIFSRDVELLEGDIRDTDLLGRVSKGVDSVFHLAGLASVKTSIADPVQSSEITSRGTLNVLIAARNAGVRRLVFSSSASVYGNAETLPTVETQPLSPQSPYAADKACGEFYCRLFHSLYQLETVVLRYFNVFGPRQSLKSGYAAVVPKFVQAVVADESPVVYGDGLQTRDFVCVDNVATANVLAATTPGIAGETFNIAGGVAISLLDLLESLRTITGKPLEPVYCPGLVGEVRHSCADITHASSRLDYYPSVSLEEGLRKTVEFAG